MNNPMPPERLAEIRAGYNDSDIDLSERVEMCGECLAEIDRLQAQLKSARDLIESAANFYDDRDYNHPNEDKSLKENPA